MTPRLTPEAHAERSEIVGRRRQDGAQWDTIAAELGVKSTTLQDWWLRGGRVGRNAVAREAAPVTPRTCLRCRGDFDSEGPGNRLCDQCRATAAGVSPLAPDPGGHEGRRAGRPR